MARSRDELRKASDHLFYEIQMLRSTMELLGTGALGDSALANAMTESFTLHARVLINLYGNREHESDVIAGDFFGDREWEGPRPPRAAGSRRFAGG